MPTPTPTEVRPELGQPVSEIETPALLVDLDVMERNVWEYAAHADAHGVRLRSHAKSHKVLDLARWQSDLTGDGILCQTLSEAEVMAQNGLDDIYLSYMVVEESKLDRLVWLSEKLDYFATTVDGPGNVDPLQAAALGLSTTINTILEIDVGLDRVGVAPGDDAVELARYIDDQPNLVLDGVMTYEGHIGYVDETVSTDEEYERACMAAMDRVESTVKRIEGAGIPVDEVMAGSTATSKYTARHPVVTEIHPGMYPFYDARLLACMPGVDIGDCAATVLATVISAPTDGRVVVDAGSKSISLDIDRMPVAKHRDGLEYGVASEEHGWIEVDDEAAAVDVGDRVEFVMPHVCTTVNLHDTLVGVRDDRVAETWAVQARGKVR